MEIEVALFQSLGWIVIAAALCALLARFIRLPTIVAYLVAGLVIGPLLGLVDESEALHLISEVGIVLLLFLVGLELSFDKIREVGKVAVVAGLGQVVFTAIGGLLFCWLLGFALMESLFLSVALTFSSTVVVVKILTDKNELDSLYGRIAVGIFLVQDLVVILVLTVLTGLGTGEAVGSTAVAFGIGKAFLGMAVLLGAVLLASRYLLPRPFGWVASSPGTLFIWSLGWCFAVVALAYHLGLSIELGAFFAGLSLAQLPYNRDLQHRIKPLMNFFVAIFFVSLGLAMEPGSARTEWLPILVLSLFVLIGNPFIFLFIISRMGFDQKTSFFTSVTVAQISEFSFVFVAMGAAAGLVGGRVLAITAMVGVITIAVSAYMILYNRELYSWVSKLGVLRMFGADKAEKGELGQEPLAGHVILVGMNTLGRKLVEELHSRGELVLAVDTDARKLGGLSCRTLLGSTEYFDVLMEAGLPRAKLLVSALRIEEANELIAYRCRQFGVPCCCQAADLSMVDNLMELGVEYLMLPKVDGVKLQTRQLREQGVLPQ